MNKNDTFDVDDNFFIEAKEQPFRVRFLSDNWEYNAIGTTATDEGGSGGNTKQRGFKLR